MIHHDFQTPAYGPTDARWIGNWWILYPTLGLLCTILVTIMACLPKREPQRKLAEQTKEETKPQEKGEGGTGGCDNSNVVAALKDIFR